MKTYLLVLILCICAIYSSLAQGDDGVVSLRLPNRNSLTFNRYTINPTFSFVREQTKYISISNKREWVQFENAPLTYLASYSGRFGENIGAAIALFQQNFGVLTTFGGTANFAYNVQLQRDSNLTFGLNIGAYKSGINTANVVTNYDDPSLQNVSDNFLLTVNPGVNYGTGFFDFGIAVSNLALYNLSTSTLIEDNPEQGIQAHVMYTGYMMASRGFFDESKFTGLIRSEFQKDDTIISAIAMLTIPKGIWGQLGYNSRFGITGGLGINITSQIALEYNYEQATGNLSSFGPSHDFTLAYRFKPNRRYNYSNNDEITGLLLSDQKRRPKARKRTTTKKASSDIVDQRKIVKEKADKKALLTEQQKVKEEADAKALLIAQQKAKKEADAKALLIAQQKAKEEADAKALLIAQQKAKEEADAKALLIAQQKAKEEADAKALLIAQQKAKEEADAKALLIAQQKAKEEADAKALLIAQQKAKEEADAKALLIAQQKAKEEADAKALLIAQQKAKEEADAKALLIAQQKAKEEADAKALLIAQQKAKEEADAKALLIAQQKAKEEADAKALLIAQQKAKEEADTQAQLSSQEITKELAKEQVKNDTSIITNPNDELSKSMYTITEDTKTSKTTQTALLKELDAIINIKDQDLKDLKKENDLSDKGVTVGPKPFKSIREENNKLQLIKTELENVITDRNKQINELKSLYETKFESDTITNEEVYIYYKKALKRLESEQINATQAKLNLEVKLSEIQVATEIERKRRIKKAAFDNEEERYSQDRKSLKNIKATTILSDTALTEKDFDFGEQLSTNIQILKNVKNVTNGYYLILAVHTNVDKRNDFVTKVIASGHSDIDFFYDVNTSKYYIYYDKFESIEQANKALAQQRNRPYNKNLSLVKIEN